MTCDVEGQRDGDTDHSGYAFQIVVDVVAGVSVGASLVDAGIADYGQKIVRGVFRVFVENHLHFLGPFDYELLAGLAATIGYVAIFKVCLFQESHVYEAHSPEIEAHQEHIAGEVECRSKRQVQRLDFLDNRQRQGTFDRLVDSGIDVAERISVLDDVIFDRTVIDSPQDASIERYGIGCYASAFMPCLVSLHYLGGEAVEHYVLVFAELLETVERGLVCLGSPDFAILFQFGDDALHEVEQRVFMRVAVELVDYIIGSVCQAIGFQFPVNLRQPLNVPADALAD